MLPDTVINLSCQYFSPKPDQCMSDGELREDALLASSLAILGALGALGALATLKQVNDDRQARNAGAAQAAAQAGNVFVAPPMTPLERVALPVGVAYDATAWAGQKAWDALRRLPTSHAGIGNGP